MVFTLSCTSGSGEDNAGLNKTEGPSASEDKIGDVDVVLVSHDGHPDNFDNRGRAFAMTAPLILSGPLSAARLGSRLLASVPGPAVPLLEGTASVNWQ